MLDVLVTVDVSMRQRPRNGNLFLQTLAELLLSQMWLRPQHARLKRTMSFDRQVWTAVSPAPGTASR